MELHIEPNDYRNNNSDSSRPPFLPRCAPVAPPEFPRRHRAGNRCSAPPRGWCHPSHLGAASRRVRSRSGSDATTRRGATIPGAIGRTRPNVTSHLGEKKTDQFGPLRPGRGGVGLDVLGGVGGEHGGGRSDRPVFHSPFSVVTEIALENRIVASVLLVVRPGAPLRSVRTLRTRSHALCS